MPAIKNLLTPLNRNILIAVLFIMVSGNLSLFRKLFEIYPPTPGNIPFLLSLALFFTAATALFFLLICHGRSARWILAAFLVACSQTAYFMDQYSVVIDTVMIDNILQTDLQEAAGLMSPGLVARTLLFGLLPAWLVLRFRPSLQGLWVELRSRALLILIMLGLIVLAVAPFSSGYASFIREHKSARFYANPTYFVNAMYQYAADRLKTKHDGKLEKVATDAVEVGPRFKKELIILVVGETARADRFSLNGYPRDTNPELRQRQAISLTNVSSCGTSTGESLPCMFSVLKRRGFDREKSLHIENALDVLNEHGIRILWRDNNSDSKGVAVRMKYENFKTSALNPVCDPECRDIGMLSGLDQYIQSNGNQDMLIVLHQMGNHGPEYYKRYPSEFERFKPVCRTGELRDCSQEAVNNAYDNAILYTDYFLSNVIDFLKKYDADYETAMLYVSDHGESLGEHGLYLHAAPYALAPEEQTHIPVVIWMGEHFDYTAEQLKPYRDYPLSHDDLFCMLMVGFEIETGICEARKDVLMANKSIKAPAP